MNCRIRICWVTSPAILCMFWALGWGSGVQAEEPGETRITAVRNQVSQSGKVTNTPTDVGHTVKAGEAVVTGERGLAELKSSDATTVRIGEKSRVAYDPKDRTVKLDQGTVVVDTPPEGGPVKIVLGGVTYTLTSEDSDPAKSEQIKSRDPKKYHLSDTNRSTLNNQDAKNLK